MIITPATGATEDDMKINEYADKYGYAADNNFAAACYDNSVDELRAALADGPDETDCKTWGIGPDEWREAVEAALADRLSE